MGIIRLCVMLNLECYPCSNEARSRRRERGSSFAAMATAVGGVVAPLDRRPVSALSFEEDVPLGLGQVHLLPA